MRCIAARQLVAPTSALMWGERFLEAASRRLISEHRALQYVQERHPRPTLAIRR